MIIKSKIARVVIVILVLSLMLCLCACNEIEAGLKDFVDSTYNPPTHTGQGDKKPSSSGNQDEIGDKEPETETPDTETPDTEDPDTEKTEEDYKAECLIKLDEIALLAAQKGNLEETISNIQNLVYNVDDGTLYFHADATGQTRPVNYFYAVYIEKELDFSTYKEALEVFEELAVPLKDNSLSLEECNMQRSRRNALKGLIDPVGPEKYEALCSLIEERCGEGSRVLWINPFMKIGNEAEAEFKVICNGKVFRGVSKLEGITKALIPPAYVDYALENTDSFSLELEEPTAIDYISFEDFIKEAMEKAEEENCKKECEKLLLEIAETSARKDLVRGETFEGILEFIFNAKNGTIFCFADFKGQTTRTYYCHILLDTTLTATSYKEALEELQGILENGISPLTRFGTIKNDIDTETYDKLCDYLVNEKGVDKVLNIGPFSKSLTKGKADLNVLKDGKLYHASMLSTNAYFNTQMKYINWVLGDESETRLVWNESVYLEYQTLDELIQENAKNATEESAQANNLT
ncbi:MAG: hypothetical protein IKB56_00955 [Clostridia bacterium]|nr:hypothetical protein [Clostridia bacterium]